MDKLHVRAMSTNLSLDALTDRVLELHLDKPLLVGFSGGTDSTALLDMLARSTKARQRGLRAIHVHHGLQPQADAWAAHCRQFCQERDVPLAIMRVHVDARGSGPEAAAREARYAAFADALQADEALLLAHHADDQGETILLKLLRGAGPHGLAGMRPWRPFAAGWLWRPWLEVAQQAIADWCRDNALASLDDPSNRDPAFSRSWLRREIMPRIRAHMPQAVASINHAGRLCAVTRDYLDDQAATHLAQLTEDNSLDAAGWLALPDALRGLVLEAWLHGRGLDAPTVAQRHELERQVATAGKDKNPCIHWPGVDLRLWRGRLYGMAPLPAPPARWEARWDGRELTLPLGTLALQPCAQTSQAPTFARALRVTLRRGGEYLHPTGDPHGRELRYVFQQQGLPPWLRPLCPLIHDGDELLAVAGLCLTDAGAAFFHAIGARPHWRYHV